MTTAAVSKTKPKNSTPAKSPKQQPKPPAKAKTHASRVAPIAEQWPIQDQAAAHSRMHAPDGCPYNVGDVVQHALADIRLPARNQRTEFDLSDLLQTMPIKQINAVQVRYRPNGETNFEVAFGERRTRAARELQWTTLKIEVVELTDEELEDLQLVENLSRADLGPVDEAHGIARLEERGYSAQQIAERVGKKVDYVRHALALSRLCEEAKQAIRDGALTATSALELAVLTDVDEQRRVLAKTLEQRPAGGDPLSVKLVRFAVEQSMMQLAKARFDPGDETLVPAAGSCFSCPKRSSQQFSLIALPGAPSEGERCTDAACYKRKQEAHWTRAASDAQALGQKVLDGDAARKVVAFGGVAKDSGYVDLDAHCSELRDGRTWREALGARELVVTVVRGDGGVAHRVVSKIDAVRVLREIGALRAPGTTQQPAASTAPAASAAVEPSSAPATTAAPLSVAQLVRMVKRIDDGIVAALLDGVIHLADPREVETRAIAKPYGAPVPADGKGRDVVLGIARGLRSTEDRLALLVRVLCETCPEAQASLSAHFAGSSSGGDTPKERALVAIRAGVHKPAEIRAKANVSPAQWQRVVDELLEEGAIRAVGDGRAREYHPASDGAEQRAPDAPTDPDVTADHEPDDVDAPRSDADQEIAGTICDVLREAPLGRTDLALRVAELDGISEADADREIEILIREGTLSESGGTVAIADAPKPRVVF